MHEEIKRLWAQTRLHVWPEEYYLMSFPAEQSPPALIAVVSSAPFFVILKERGEVSFTLPEEIWQPFSKTVLPRAVAGPYHVITFDLNLDLSICGYFAPAAARLAEAGISIVPQCAYLKDHVLIQAGQIERAVEVLQKLIESAKGGGD